MGNHLVETFSLGKVVTTSEKIVKLYEKYQVKGKYLYKQLGNVLPVSKRVQIELSDHYTTAWIWIDNFRWVEFPLSQATNLIKTLPSGLTWGAVKSSIHYEVQDEKYTSKEFRKEIEKELEFGLDRLGNLLLANQEEIYRFVTETNRNKSKDVADKDTIKQNLKRLGLYNISNIDD